MPFSWLMPLGAAIAVVALVVIMRPGPRPPSAAPPLGHWLGLSVLAILLVGVGWFVTQLFGWFACSFENTNCVDDPDAQVEYEGRLFDYQGRPVPGFVLLFSDEVYGAHFAFPVRTDGHGRFCVRALKGRYGGSIRVPGQTHVAQHVVRSNAPVDPRFADPAVREALRRKGSSYTGPDAAGFMTVPPASPGSVPPSPSISAGGAHTALELWDPRTDATSQCHEVTARPPWYNFDDLGTSWQFTVLNLAPLSAILLFLCGALLFDRGCRRGSPQDIQRSRAAFRSTVALVAVNAIVFFSLWPVLGGWT